MFRCEHDVVQLPMQHMARKFTTWVQVDHETLAQLSAGSYVRCLLRWVRVAATCCAQRVHNSHAGRAQMEAHRVCCACANSHSSLPGSYASYCHHGKFRPKWPTRRVTLFQLTFGGVQRRGARSHQASSIAG